MDMTSNVAHTEAGPSITTTTTIIASTTTSATAPTKSPVPANPTSLPPGEAGPSRLDPSSTTPTARNRHLPQTTYASIEYPGPVSAPTAILDVISQTAINECFNAPTSQGSLLEMNYRADQLGAPVRGYRMGSQKLLVKVVKKRRRPTEAGVFGGNANPGADVGSSEDGAASRKGKEKEHGVFTAEVLGPITQTVRFRSMADYHFTPNFDGPTAELVAALIDLDYETILDYTMPDVSEHYVNALTPPPQAEGEPAPDPELYHKSLLDIQPIPIMSYLRVPPIYNYKMPAASALDEYEDPRTGEIKQRYLSKSRFLGFGPEAIGHTMPLGEVPSEPVKGVKLKLPKMDADLLEKLRALFLERPVWIRYGLLTRLTPQEVRELTLHKFYIPAVAYTFGAGPYWKCLIRLGYDPRQHVEARVWQRIYFYIQVQRGRNTILYPRNGDAGGDGQDEDDEETADKYGENGDNVVNGDQTGEGDEAAAAAQARAVKNSLNALEGAETGSGTSAAVWEARQNELVAQGKRPPIDRSRGHIFDGQALHRGRPDYQLCDITDPLVSKYIWDERLATDYCDPGDGWYKPDTLNLIRNMVRTKYLHLRDTGEPPKDSVCYDLIEEYERGLLGGADKGGSSGAGKQAHREMDGDEDMAPRGSDGD